MAGCAVSMWFEIIALILDVCALELTFWLSGGKVKMENLPACGEAGVLTVALSTTAVELVTWSAVCPSGRVTKVEFDS